MGNLQYYNYKGAMSSSSLFKRWDQFPNVPVKVSNVLPGGVVKSEIYQLR